MCRYLLIVLAAVICVQNFAFVHTQPCNSTCGDVSEADKEKIVNHHNKLRKLVAKGELKNQPKASNMLKISWDDELAEAAKKVALTCKHKSVRVKDKRFRVGQSLLSVSKRGPKPPINWIYPINHWFDEHKKYKYPKNKANVADYTQLIWADTNKIGCAAACWGNRWKVILYVCNYGPGGNVRGHAPYKTGDGCEDLC